jgi:hypothetical protein
MTDLIQRFGKKLIDQQLALCEEWRKVHSNPPELLLEDWEKEVNAFMGTGSLSGDAWARLRNWYESQAS